jgi:hypothetical protein
MKQYIYNQAAPYAGYDTTGNMFELHLGDVITACDNGVYGHYDKWFNVSVDRLKSDFRRIYTAREQERYERIHERAMIAAMQSLIECQNDKPISSDMRELENITSNAIWFADSLVNKLKDKEF